MKVIIATPNIYKQRELNKYFENIGIIPYNVDNYNLNEIKEKFPQHICIREQTTLINKKDGKVCNLKKFEEVIHKSIVSLDIYYDGETNHIKFMAEVDGFIFPTLKTNKADVFDWDDIFISSSTMKSYQEMKDNDIKNSARDLAFTKLIDYLPNLFDFENKINLNFNPIKNDEVISFEPIIKNFFDNNKYYKIAYKNPLFRSIINSILKEGLFIKRANNRKQKNYWLPGLNAGIPLTPKKDELHELTFMFHDIMHFLYPDLIVLDNDKKSKNKYILTRMMSEAFTLVLADMLFISLLKKENVEYDYTKRKIYPIFESMEFEITKENLPKIKELLWANVCFALLGQDQPLKSLVQNDVNFENYKAKYKRFFQEDYCWTAKNFENMSKQITQTRNWYNLLKENYIFLPSTENFCPNLSIEMNLVDQIKEIFQCMFNKLEKTIMQEEEYQEEVSFSNAVKKYMYGQIYIFFKFETFYNKLFLQEILKIIKKNILTKEDLHKVLDLYHAYIDKLAKDKFISSYDMKNFKNIYPVFAPYYVFYERKTSDTFEEVLNKLFKE